MAGKSRRFGPDYIKNDTETTPESLPDHLTKEFKAYYAELSNEQKTWNAQRYSEDHNDARRDQRRYFFRALEQLHPAAASSLYQLMPAFRQIFADHPDPHSSRRHFAQMMLVSFSSQYLQISEAQRARLDLIIEAKLAAIAARQYVRQPFPFLGSASDEEVRFFYQVEFEAIRRLMKMAKPNREGEVEDQFMVIYRPLYRWMSKWNLLEPWVADVALSTLLDWEKRGIIQPDAQQFTTTPRFKSATHNTLIGRFPQLDPEDLHLEITYKADWQIDIERFNEFEERCLKYIREKFKAFKEPIDEQMADVGYEQATGRTNVYDTEPFRWLIRYQIDGLTFEQIAEEELERREKEARDNRDTAEDTDSTKKERDRLTKLSKLDDSIERATQRLAGRIDLTLRGTNQN